jgi:AraC-like DNA-binding protein/mannose-6-phosphate isomerase-like protein (cupin superfamily)
MKAQFEKAKRTPENSFIVFLHEVDEFDAPWHYHPEYELTLILHSQGVRYVGNSMENFDAGDLVMVGPNLPHCWKNTGENPGKARAVVVQWSEDLLGAGWIENPEFKPIQRLLQLSDQGIRFTAAVSERVQDWVQSLPALAPFPRLMRLLDILDFLAGAADFELLCEQGFAYPLNFDDNQRVNLVYNYIRENYQNKVTLAEIAGLVHMSEEAFSRFFSKIMHKPLFTFLNEYRVTMASKMLIETDMQIAEIGYACGYESLPFFYRQFRKFAGMAPLGYRKQFREMAKQPEPTEFFVVPN